ncbi:eyes absent homolog 2-like isoform X1 [Amphibalanus amphitrite]|uniref:eyes absent homolog 2-like isoform X1 n=1 Tax=Amphibalanus amphitrite TaxID=1232801 RepID=UPI001C9036BB|nr:eyes absent homolog 2-like isoform X1 [Amphibalanus amphitrite]
MACLYSPTGCGQQYCKPRPKKLKKSPGVDSNENNIDTHRSPEEILGLAATSPFRTSGAGTPTTGAELAGDTAPPSHPYPAAPIGYPGPADFALPTKHEPSVSPDGSYSRSYPDALLDHSGGGAGSQNELLFSYGGEQGAPSGTGAGTAADSFTHEYLKSLSMQAYGAQASPAACLQAPSMYNMYGATHSQRGQQRSAGLSQNYWAPYGGGLSSSAGTVSQVTQSPYMAAYNYGGGGTGLSANPLNQTPYTTGSQQAAPEYGSYGAYSPQAALYYNAAAGFSPYMSPVSAAAGSHSHSLSSSCTPNSAQTYHLSPLPPVSTPDGSEFSESGTFLYHSPTLGTGRRRRNSNGNGTSSRRRRRGEPSPDDDLAQKIDRIFIWDLDETIIVFHSLLTGQYARENGKDQAVCSQIGSHLETLVFTTGEELFFLKELDVDSQYPTHVTNIDDLHTEDNNQDLSNYNFLADGLASTLGVPAAPLGYSLARNNVSADIARKIAFRHRRVKELYNMYRNNVAELFRAHLHGRHPSFEHTWTKTRQELEIETNGWLTQACSCLKLIQERKQCTNVMVTRNMLMTTFAKTVIFGLADCFEPENIFSAYKVGFESCLNTIRQKYAEKHGREVICVIVGKPDKPDSPSIITAARQFGMPYFPINSDKDLLALKFFLQCGYM